MAQWDRKEIERGYLLPLWPLALNGTFLSTTAAGQRLDPLDLFARLLVEDGVAEVDVPVQARVRVVLVVVLLGGRVRGMCARLIHVNLLVRLAGLRGVTSTCGASFALQAYCLIFKLKTQ